MASKSSMTSRISESAPQVGNVGPVHISKDKIK